MTIGVKITACSLACIAALGAALAVTWSRANRALESKQEELVTSQAVAIGVTTAEQIAATRSVYSQELVRRLSPHGTKFSPTPEKGEAPLPATFITGVSNALKASAGKNGVTFSMLSGWNVNADQGLKTEFDTLGWANLLQQESIARATPADQRTRQYRPFYQRGVDEHGSPAMFVMTADLASAQSCVDCHNQLESSAEIQARRANQPVKRFELGDLMGAVVTRVPLANTEAIIQDLAKAQESASLQIWSCIGVGFLATTLVSIWLGRRISRPVKRLAASAERIADGDLEQSIDVISKDELGLLAASFRKIVDAQKSLTAAATRIAAGDMSVQVVERSDKDQLSKSFQQLQGEVRGLVDETREIVTAANDGQLDKRGDAAKFQGVYRELVQGFNQTLDAVVEPVTEASSVLSQVAQRDLTVRVQGQYQGDHAKIKNALNTALDNLEEALGQAAAGSDQVTCAATQIAEGSQSLAQGASEQASSLEEISSSLEEMASMTRQNAENSTQGKILAADATGAAQRGNEAMGRMAEAIDKIKASSDATAKIIKTIDEIAFQTNLLALNAAVEAARAGEAGKGFAVVAEEVRNLAQRSAEAAKNTANMIEESVKNAEGGVRITEEVAKILVEIGEGNRKVNDLVAEIAAASGEQSKGIEQVNLAVTQLDKVTQQNAANSEESASAAEELNSQAVSLSQTVGQFKIVSQGHAPVSPVATGGKKPAAKPAKNGHASKKLVGAGTNGNGKASRFLCLDEEDFQGF